MPRTTIQPPEPPRAKTLEQALEYINRLYRWQYEVYRRLEQAGILDWEAIDTQAGSVADLGTKDHNLLDARDAAGTHPHASLSSVLQADDTSTSGTLGKHVTDAQVKKYEDHRQASMNVHGIGATSAVVGTNTTQTLENKSASDIQLLTSGPLRPLAEGMLSWDADAKTLAVKLDGADPVLQVGQEMMVRVVNKTGATLTNGTVVYMNGAQGNRPTVAPARADAATTAKVLGMVTHDIANNQNGYVTVFGLVRGLNTSAYAVNDYLYLSAASAGLLTSTAPAFPNYDVYVCRVIVVHGTDGIVGVNPGINPVNHVMLNHLGARDALIGDIGGGNYTEIEADGTLVAHGDATAWDDSMIPAVAFRNAAAALTLDALVGGVYQPRFDLNDEIHMAVQLPHSIKEGSVIRPHIHLTNKNAIGAANYNVAFEFEWGWSSIGSAFAATTTTETVTVSFQNAAALTHKTSNMTAITPGVGQGTISSVLICRLKRVAAAAQPHNTNDIFTLGFDIHFEKDTMGSRTYDTK